MGWVVSKSARNNSCILIGNEERAGDVPESVGETSLGKSVSMVTTEVVEVVKTIATNLNVVKLLPPIEQIFPENIKFKKIDNFKNEINSKLNQSPEKQNVEKSIEINFLMKKDAKLYSKKLQKSKRLTPILNNLFNENENKKIDLNNEIKIKKNKIDQKKNFKLKKDSLNCPLNFKNKEIKNENDVKTKIELIKTKIELIKTKNKEIKSNKKCEINSKRKKLLSPLNIENLERKNNQNEKEIQKKIIKPFFKKHKIVPIIIANKLKENKIDLTLIKTNNDKKIITNDNEKRNKCFSPLNVLEFERNLSEKEFYIEEEKESVINDYKIIKVSHGERAQSANNSTNKSSNNTFNSIINDFNKKLENLIKCNCNNCYGNCEVKKNNAGKITFFFLKKYGNFGKFILARLNDFFDNIYENKTNDNLDYFPNDFPLPCNIKDIEFSGDLKQYFKINDKKIKHDKHPSKLPRFIKNKENIENNNITNLLRDSENKKNKKIKENNEIINNNKLKISLRKSCTRKKEFKNEKEIMDEIKIIKNIQKGENEMSVNYYNTKDVLVDKGDSFDISFYNNIIKERRNEDLFNVVEVLEVSARSCDDNYYKERKSDIVYESVELRDRREEWEKYCYPDFVDVMNIPLYEPLQRGMDEDDIGNTTFFRDEEEEEEVTTLANELMNDLWRKDLLKDFTFKTL